MFEESRSSAFDFVRKFAQQRLEVDPKSGSIFSRLLGQSPKTYAARERNRTVLDGITLYSTLGEHAPAADGSPQRFGVLHTIDEALAQPGWKGLGMHPHVDTEVITFVISGELKHEEGTGRVRHISAYELQVLSSGKGADHNESNASAVDPLEFFQILIDSDEQGAPVRVDKIRLPVGLGDGVSTLAAGSDLKVFDQNVLPLRQRTGRISFLELSNGAKLSYERSPLHGNGVYFFVLEGEIAVDDDSILGRRDGLGLRGRSDSDGAGRLIELEGRATRSLALIFEVAAENVPFPYKKASPTHGYVPAAAPAAKVQMPAPRQNTLQRGITLRDQLLRTVAPPPAAASVSRMAASESGDTNVSDYLVDFLLSKGVRHVFGYAGSSVLPLIEAIRKRQGEIEWVLMRHEGSAALAASAASKLTGGIGALVVSSGPGATNTITGLLDAERDRAAVFCVTGKIPSAVQYRTPYQDVDNAHIVGAAVRNSVTITQEQQLPPVLRRAAAELQRERGVWHIAVSNDLLSKDLSGLSRSDALRHFVDRRESAHAFSAAMLESIVRIVSSTEQVVIAVGPRAQGTGRLIEQIAQLTGAPIITQIDAKGIVDELHPHAFGVLGVFGYPANQCAYEALQSATGLLMIGVTEARYFLQDKDGSQKSQLTVVQLEPSHSTPSSGFKVDLRAEGPLDSILEGIQETLRNSKRTTRELPRKLSQIKEGHELKLMKAMEPSSQRRLHPGAAFLTLSTFLSGYRESIVALDVGALTLWASQYLLLTQEETLLTSRELATMGWALPASIAAALTVQAQGERARLVVGIVGDGAMQMTLAELGSAVQSQARFILLVINNGTLGAISQQQPNDERRYGTAIFNPDFVAIARAFGAEGEHVTNMAELTQALDRAVRSEANGPYLIEVDVDDQAPMPLFVG